MYFNQGTDDDRTLVRRSLDGDATAFETLVVRYQRVAFNVALRMLGDREDARDATQNAFVKLFERLNTYRPEYRFFSWMYRILINECLNGQRRRRAECDVDPETPDSRGPADPVEAEERRRDVRGAILALPLAQREVIVLRHFAGLSYDEIASAIGVPAKTVKSRLYSARQELAERLTAWSLVR